MAKDYTELVTTILDNIGGPDNIVSVAHCITRPRLKLKDESIAMDNADIISARPEVIQVMNANGQVHVVVGQHHRGRLRPVPRPSGRTPRRRQRGRRRGRG